MIDYEEREARLHEQEKQRAHESKILGTPTSETSGAKMRHVNVNDPTQHSFADAIGGFPTYTQEQRDMARFWWEYGRDCLRLEESRAAREARTASRNAREGE